MGRQARRKRTKALNRLSISLIALIAATPALAQTGDIALDEIVVTANREETPLSETGASVKVIPTEALRASGESGIAGFFRRLAGLTVTTRGTIGTQAGVLIRGASQNYIAATVDGIDVTDPSNTQVAFDFGQLTTLDLGRVEVLKGSQSALYGAGAVGGVVSMETLRPTQDGLHHMVAAELGSFNTASASYTLTQRDAVNEFAFSLSRLQTDGFSNAAASEGNREADGFRNSRLSFYAARQLDGGFKLGVNGFGEHSQSDYDPAYYMPGSTIGTPGPIAAGDVYRDQIALGDGESFDEVLTRQSTGLRVFAEGSTGAVDHKASVSYFHIRRSYLENEALALGFQANDPNDFNDDTFDRIEQTRVATRYDGTRLKAEYQGGFDALGGRFVLGLEALSERLEQGGYYGRSDETTDRRGVFGDYSATLGTGAEVTLSARADHHSLFGTMPSARVAVVQPMGGSTLLRAQVGTGYRAPSNFELFSAYGATSLQPETSRSADIGLETGLGGESVLRVTAFYLSVSDLIDFDLTSSICPAAQAPAAEPGCYDQVAGESLRSGLEVEAVFDLGRDIRLETAYTLTESRTNASTAWAQIARHQLGLGLSAPLSDRMTGRIDVLSAFDRPDWDDFGSRAADYTVLNASVTHDFGNGTEAYLRIENLTNEEYQLVQHYGTSPRAVFAGIRAAF